jgi:hypothetical protein
VTTFSPFAPETIIDLADYYPGPLARTHALRAVDGRYYRFRGDVTHGVWSRSIDPGCVDHHLWTPEGMYYLGWEQPGEWHWSVPPELVLPRFWNPATHWMRTYQYVLANRLTTGSNTFTVEPFTVKLDRVTVNGELLFYARGTNHEGGLGAAGEEWWLSPTLAVRGGGCSPGLRGFRLISGGQITGTAEFVEWVPLGLVP